MPCPGRAGTLNLAALGGFNPAPGSRFTIIQNDTDSPTQGYFDGLPDNAVVTVGGVGLRITYNRPSTDAQGNPQDTNDVVLQVNRPPQPLDDFASTTQDTAVTVAVLANDTDPDGDTLTISGMTNGSHGTVTAGGLPGTLVYTPDPGYTGTDTFTYTVSDGYGGTATATVTITVSASPPGGGGTISGMVWNDQDGNGVREYEPGAYEVTVQLLDANGAVVATVQTWNGGMYSFGNLAPGQYRIRVIPPAGYTFSPQDVGSDDTDSDVDIGGYSGLVTITGGDTFNIDAGIHA